MSITIVKLTMQVVV